MPVIVPEGPDQVETVARRLLALADDDPSRVEVVTDRSPVSFRVDDTLARRYSAAHGRTRRTPAESTSSSTPDGKPPAAKKTRRTSTPKAGDK
ncbi:hypothetical protein ACQEVF_57105 [Nonomuraea polychroma]|uniref:hypothetical protein n=1 Tax=Nonomuraea polychroma TaxID=46176 RepID=UPI003D8A4CF8